MYDVKKISKICSRFSALLIDDDEDARGEVESILTHLFSVVLVAKDGKEALEIYKRKRVDIIITDLNMPKMDGFELTQAVRKINQKQKIIVMSAHTEADIIVKAIKSGVDGYILKPINASQMFEAIEKTVVSLKIEKENSFYQEELENRVDNQAKELINQLEYDPITGLPNKQKLHLDFITSRFNDGILLNIDNFSHINCSYGYDNGDLLLKGVASFLKQITHHTIYKGIGDEFFIALESSSAEKSLKLAQEIKKKVYTKRFKIGSIHVRITFSIGIISINDNDISIPYSKAQLAIMDMRKVHKNVIGHYQPDSKTEQYQQKMHEWAHKTKLALDFDLLIPYYQPIINLATNEIEKYECLARIIEQEETIFPSYFIEAARIAGMVTDITRRMIEKSFKTFSTCNKEFSINITDDDFKEGYLVDYLLEHCEKHNIHPSQVALEVLENISDYDLQHANFQMEKLKNIGFKIAIDDFGADSSNFARVQKLQIDYLKIDGSFIKDIALNQNSMIIVKTIVFYAKHSGVNTIAEFVHDEETYKIIKELGIDYAQGYYISEPLKDIL
ncbi:EAL domain-containing protein [Candidatus Sulfurimonas marisnigri]|uniref:EAL domain-containing protein n=1 Tax=Candidatus Sulfurimonas marisnigri TaxID=2740405 RepID=A0A7S7RR44_9BACT|nr:EAL domain-containing response regulator [Candidatus Sulfurimonas marisnigri]QOY55304.1 EAL domain-containing protein [Candidatus Sulfurimonas marisnigri]